MSPSAAAPVAPQAPPMTPQQQMIVDAFNSEVYVNNRMDVQHTPLYDTVTLAALAVLNVNSSSYFTSVGPASGKTLAQTNLTQSQKLAAPEAFSIFGFRFRYSENISILDIYNLINGFCFEFYLGQKPYQRGPLWYYNAGGGISAMISNAVATTTTAVYNNGVPGRSEMHKLAISIVIENQMTFYGQLNGNAYTLNTGGTGLTSIILLDGLYARGVQ
jgi:hypothetical protein